MGLATGELQLIEQRVTNDGKSAGFAYVLWFFFGIFGNHRFYLGRAGSGIAMLLTLGGFFIWWIIDLFLIGGMVRHYNGTLRQRLTVEMLANGKRDNVSGA
jgi:TM2 domain-containing membrane protein YozV